MPSLGAATALSGVGIMAAGYAKLGLLAIVIGVCYDVYKSLRRQR